MRALLEEFPAGEGHETVVAAEGMAALAIAAPTLVDAAVIDVVLPGTDGLELRRHLRTHPARPQQASRASAHDRYGFRPAMVVGGRGALRGLRSSAPASD